MSRNLNKPNKKLEIIGLIMFVIGASMVLLRIFVIKEAVMLIVGIPLGLFGAVVCSVGRFGLDKTVEMTSAYEKSKAKNIAKGVKEGLKDKK